MKKLSAAISVILILCVGLISCARTQASSYQEDADRQSTISALESQIAKLQQDQAASDAESQKKLAELKALLDSIISDPTEGSEAESGAAPDPSIGFTYTVTDGYATITGYVGNDTELVIPATVDGYRVTAIADSAFEDSSIKSVIISNGVQSIGWFAFNGCMKLTSVTVPSSVVSIGYSAFGSAGSSLTLYCHSQSFALSYAKSYGLTYAVI